MTTTFNVYCDESGHLPRDAERVMVLGAVWCPTDESRAIADAIRDIKRQHGLSPSLEVKWTKISPGKIKFYLDLIDFFFDTTQLRFRGLVIPDKTKLDHRAFDQDHDVWYYKMYFSMLKAIITPDDRFRIYLDIKDTRSADKTRKLHDVLCNAMYDFDQSIIERIQTVRSHEVEPLQLADLLIGAVRHANAAPAGGRAKDVVVERVRARSKYSLVRSTLLTEQKMNVFIWRAQEPMG